MPTCPNGHEVEANVAFCRQCGVPLAPEDAPTTVLESPVPQAPVPAQRTHARQTQSNTAVYVLAGVIVLIGLAVIGFVLLNGSNDDLGGPAPTVQNTPSSAGGGSTPSTSAHASPTTPGLPAGGTACPGSVGSAGQFGTIGKETSCGFVEAVYQSYVNAGGVSQAQGQSVTVTATSPATHRVYSNIVCTAGPQWVTCVGGNNNTARMFFTHP